MELGTWMGAFSHSCIFPVTDVFKPRYVPWQSVPEASVNCHASYWAKPHLQMVLCENFITQEESKFCKHDTVFIYLFLFIFYIRTVLEMQCRVSNRKSACINLYCKTELN